MEKALAARHGGGFFAWLLGPYAARSTWADLFKSMARAFVKQTMSTIAETVYGHFTKKISEGGDDTGIFGARYANTQQTQNTNNITQRAFGSTEQSNYSSYKPTYSTNTGSTASFPGFGAR